MFKCNHCGTVFSVAYHICTATEEQQANQPETIGVYACPLCGSKDVEDRKYGEPDQGGVRDVR